MPGQTLTLLDSGGDSFGDPLTRRVEEVVAAPILWVGKRVAAIGEAITEAASR